MDKDKQEALGILEQHNIWKEISPTWHFTLRECIPILHTD